MQLAKAHLDVGTMVNDWEAAEAFWANTIGLQYEKYEKIGGGVRQYRFGVNGTVVKVNHSRTPLNVEPTIHRRLRIALARCSEPENFADPEGVEIELVPVGHDGIVGIEIVNATADPVAARRFWVDGLGSQEFGDGRYKLGDTIITCLHEPGLIGPTTRNAAGFRYLTVQVTDVDTDYARLVDMGFIGEVDPVSLGETARISFVRDPDGGYVEVSERAEVTGSAIRQD